MISYACCSSPDLSPSYASVLAFGAEDLRHRIRRAEQQGLQPCVTAWCPRHQRISVLYDDDFQSASAYFSHVLASI